MPDFIFLVALFLNLAASCTAAYFGRQKTLSEQQARFFHGALVVWATSATTLIGVLTRH